ncbi:2-dehydro-3-deoxyphosphooctonate aldolase [Flavobacterium sp.]|uniref:2-dehydro-3-deoxyphosphooctonate aldolase n=1 Tax=Flavobacterium sp. TaxID=239 RepID=UPI0039E2D637
MKIKYAFLLLFAVVAVSCVSTKSTIKNIDDSLPDPVLAGNAFVLTEFATDKKYGYDPDYPINVYFNNTKDEKINQQRFLNALAGPNGEKIISNKVETCCPFPTKRSDMGAGFLDVYQITWEGNKNPVRLYFNIYEKGALLVPIGFTLKKK